MSAPSQEQRWGLIYGVMVAVLMIAQQLAGKAIRDAFFLSHFNAAALPTAMIVASSLSIVAVLGTSRVYQMIAPARLVPWVFAVSGLWFAGEWALSMTAPRWAAASLYIHTTSFGAVVVSGFWSVVNERFDPHTAKRVIGRIAGGATLGGVIGGFAAWQGAAFLSVGSMIVVLAVVNFACAIVMWRFGGGVTERELPSTTKRAPSVLEIMEETPYLWQLAFLVATSALAAAAFDYVFKAKAAAAFSDSESLVQFFSLFYLGLGIGTFVFQQLFATRALRWLGLTATVATMPAAVVGVGAFALVVGGLWSVVALRGIVAILESSLYRSGYELLYTPLTPEKKRPTKTMIDVGGDKLGAAVGSGIALVVVQAFPTTSDAVLLALAVGCGALAIYISLALHSGYVASLADSLQHGRLKSSALNLDDRTTRRTVNETRVLSPSTARASLTPPGRDRALIENSLGAALTAGRAEGARPADDGARTNGTDAADLGSALAIAERLDGPWSVDVSATSDTLVAGLEVQSELHVSLRASDEDDILKGLAALRSQAPDRVAFTLRWFPQLPPELVPAALTLLADRQMRPMVWPSLTRIAPLHIGLLSDTLLGASRPLAVRRVVPALLAQVAVQRSADALVAGLRMERLELRLRCGAALRRITHRNPRLRVDRDAVMSAVVDMLVDADAGRFGGRWPEDGLVLGTAFIALATVLPSGPLRLALEALADDNPGRRGTGLEYIDNVLPGEVRQTLRRRLESRGAAQSAIRAEGALIRAAVEAETTEAVDIDQLVAALRASVSDSDEVAELR